MARKIKVRIAVAVDLSGDWVSSGSNGVADEESIAVASDWVGRGAALYWIEAEVDVPEAAVVAGNVVKE